MQQVLDDRSLSTRVALRTRLDAQTTKSSPNIIGKSQQQAQTTWILSIHHIIQPQPWHAKQFKQTRLSNSSSAPDKPRLRRQSVPH